MAHISMTLCAQVSRRRIVLSGETGTKLKCQIIGQYYKLWWEITSGGSRSAHRFPTSLVEMNAGTGEVYIEDTKETLAGSAGHALDLKLNHPDTSKLKLILVEENADCWPHLKNLISVKWPSLSYNEDPHGWNESGVFLFNKKQFEVIPLIEKIELGNALFFFDPLLFTPMTEIETLARNRLKSYYQTGTEFIIFLFTSDWFLGRNELSALPETPNEDKWSPAQRSTVSRMDDLFGRKDWRPILLTSGRLEEKMQLLVDLYERALNRWFRYVLPLPFEPKPNQEYHLFICSNYEDGVRITWDFYASYTSNPQYSPDNRDAFARFMRLNGGKVTRPFRGRKPAEWKILWPVIRTHYKGVCDIECKDLRAVEPNISLLQTHLEWLAQRGYLVVSSSQADAWPFRPTLYQLNWAQLKKDLNIDPPSPLKPLKPK